MAQHTQNVRLIELGVAQVGINARDLGLAMAALAQEGARSRVSADAPVALTDSSGGTAVGVFTLARVPMGEVAIVDNVMGMAPKGEFDTAMGLIEDGHQELASKVNELIVLAAGTTAAAVSDTAGAAADDTIAAIAGSFTAATTIDGEGVDAATGNQQISIARGNQAAIAAAVNYVRVAMGLDVITDNSGGMFERTQTAYVTADQADTAAGAVDGANSLTNVSGNAALTALRNNIASLAAALNQMRGTVAIGPFVVATHNPRSRFVNADVTV